MQPLVAVPRRDDSISKDPLIHAVGVPPAASAAAAAAASSAARAPAKADSPAKAPAQAMKATPASGRGGAGTEGWGEGTSDVDGIQSYEVVQVFAAVGMLRCITVGSMPLARFGLRGIDAPFVFRPSTSPILGDAPTKHRRYLGVDLI